MGLGYFVLDWQRLVCSVAQRGGADTEAPPRWRCGARCEQAFPPRQLRYVAAATTTQCDTGIHSARVSEQLPHLGGAFAAGQGVHSPSVDKARGGIYAYFEQLAARLRRVRVCCGDWQRVLGPSVTWRHGLTGIFLDPPYDRATRADVYAHESDVFSAVQAWAVANGENPLLRIAICGYDFTMPDGWIAVHWKTNGGYGLQGSGRGRDNAGREVVYFSRHCSVALCW